MKRFILAVALSCALPAGAETLRRVAVLVGANQGALGRASLRYSYSDADQMAAVLTQAGQFAPADVHVLRDPEPQALLEELDRELSGLKAGGGESMLLFYYSGHADSAALYPNGKPLSFAQLRERLDSQAATVRIGIIDACSGGGWTGAKGIYPTAPFVVDVPLQLTSEGSVLIASSSGVESAHEAESVYGSFFTHHLVAALRGAADQHDGGVVTLNDAFAYARERTIRDSAAAADPQHPSFSMNLHGRADLPLTRLAQAKTSMNLTETEGPLQLIHLESGLVVMEIPAGSRVVKLSVPSGRYLVRRQQASGNYSREVVVQPDQSVTVDEGELQLSSFPRGSAKEFSSPIGSWPRSVNDRPLALKGGMYEVQLGLLAEADSNRPLTRDGGGGLFYIVGNGGFGGPWSFAPQVRFGATDHLTFSVGIPGGLCLNDNGCTLNVAGTNARAQYTFSSGPVELGAIVGIGMDGQQAIPLSGGLTLRVGRGWPVTLQLTGLLTENDQTQNLPEYGSYSYGAVATFQITEALSLDLQAERSGNFRTGDPYLLPLTAGATYAFSPHVDLRFQVLARGLGQQQQQGAKQYGLLLSFRP